MPSSNHMKEETFMEASFINDIHTWDRLFLQLLLLKACETFLFRQCRKVCSILWSVSVFFAFLEKRRSNKCS